MTAEGGLMLFKRTDSRNRFSKLKAFFDQLKGPDEQRPRFSLNYTL